MLSEIFAVLGQTLSIYSFILIIRILLTWFPGIDWSNGILSALTSITDRSVMDVNADKIPLLQSIPGNHVSKILIINMKE